ASCSSSPASCAASSRARAPRSSSRCSARRKARLRDDRSPFWNADDAERARTNRTSRTVPRHPREIRVVSVSPFAGGTSRMTLLAHLGKDARLLLRNRALLVALLAYPFLLAIVLGAAFQSPPARLSLAVVDEDAGSDGLR